MTTTTTPSSLALVPSLKMAWQDVDSSFERFCLTAGIGAIEQMLCEDAQQLVGTRHNRGGEKRARKLRHAGTAPRQSKFCHRPGQPHSPSRSSPRLRPSLAVPPVR